MSEDEILDGQQELYALGAGEAPPDQRAAEMVESMTGRGVDFAHTSTPLPDRGGGSSR